MTGLGAGTYKVLVSCTLRDGSWTEAQQIAQLRILPPWYASGWFLAICVVLVPGIVAAALSHAKRKRVQEVESQPLEETVSISAVDEAFLSKLNALIEENIGNSGLDTALMCKELCMSRASLFNKMKALTGMGSSEYITRLRMERAISLISETELSLSEVAERVGYASSAYFSTAFKQYTGEAPSKYKKKLKQSKS